MKQRSKAVAEAIADTYAILASAAAKGAVQCVEMGYPADAEQRMAYVGRWLDAAGARATTWRYRKP